jgi:uncharacterized protein
MKTRGTVIRIRSMLVLVLILSLIAGFCRGGLAPQRADALSPDVVISQVYGAGGFAGATYQNDYVELFNHGSVAITLDGWSLQYASPTGTFNSSNVFPLSGTIQPGQYFLVQMYSSGSNGLPLPAPDLTSSINMGNTQGKVMLATVSTLLPGGTTPPFTPDQMLSVKDLVGWGGATYYEGTGPAHATSLTTAIYRGDGGYSETDNNSADFAAFTPMPRNTSSPLNPGNLPVNPAGLGAAAPDTLFAGDSVLLTVGVIPGTHPDSTGLAVTCNLTAIGGPPAQALYDDGTNGDVTGSDKIFSFSTAVASGTVGGVKDLPCTISDAQSRSGSTSIQITVLEIIPIGTVQGPVSDGDNGAEQRSPYAPPAGNNAGETVAVQGVIYEKTLQATTGASTYKGFFIQNTSATMDADPNTSDGLFVFMNTSSTISKPGGSYTPTVGDEVVITGVISEYNYNTEMSSPTLSKPVVRSGVDIELELPAFDINPPANLEDANRYWERREGMRAQVPAGSLVLGGRNVFTPADAEIWLARSDSTIAQRAGPYERKAFRDAHPLDDNYDPNHWDGNGYRYLIGSLGIKATASDAGALIGPARSYATLNEARIGGVNYTYSKYRIEIREQPVFSEGVDPADNNPPQVFDPSHHYSIVDYDPEELFDYRDNPYSPCDFNSPGNPGYPSAPPPYLNPVRPPFDYVPASDAGYQARLNDIALQIINDLHSPDILMVQEVENQDICIVSGSTLSNTGNDNADGQPDVLQELALKIAALGGPAYEAAFDRDSADLGGFTPAFLYRTDRVQLRPAAGGPVLGSDPAVPGYTSIPYNSDVSNPKALNAVLPDGVAAYNTMWVFERAVSVALFRIYSAGIGEGTYCDVYVINNHFVAGPANAVEQRIEQSEYNAGIVDCLQAADPKARIVLGGYLGVYPRPDDITAPPDPPTDQLGALYDPGLGLKNLWEVLLDEAPESAYGFIYTGQAQTLDHMFVNQRLLADLEQYRTAHINSDFPADYPDDAARGASDHDPNVASFKIPPSNLQISKEAGPATVNAGGTAGFTITVSNTGTVDALDVAVADDLPEGVDWTASQGTISAEGVLTLDIGTLAAGDSEVIEVSGPVTWENAGEISNTATATSSNNDPASLSSDAAITVTAPDMHVTVTAALATDADGDGALGPGDTLQYTADITNTGDGEANAVVFTNYPDANTTLIAGSVTVSQVVTASKLKGVNQTLWKVIKGNHSGDKMVEVDLATIPSGGTAAVTFKVTINSPLWEFQVTNQGTLSGSNFPNVRSDDTHTSRLNDATITHIKMSEPIRGPGMSRWGIIILIALFGGALVWVGRRKEPTI